MGDPSQARELQPDDLEAFAARVRTLHGRRASLAAATQAALTLAVPALVLAWLVAAWRGPVATAVAGFVALTALTAWLRARRIADASLLRVAAVDAVAEPQLLAEVGDELATWLELRRARPSPMHGWLGRDVGTKLVRLSPATVGALGRRRLGASLWLLPLVVLLLLAFWLCDLLAPPWSGVLGGRPNQPDPSAGDGGNGGRGRGNGSGQSPAPSPDKPDPAPERNPAPPSPPPPAPQPGPEPPPAEPPAPLLDLPAQQHFVVPEFVGDGPTRRARVHAAEIEQGAPAGASSERTGDTTPTPTPPPAAERFARAAEAAAAARHVPPSEQPMVRRFFDTLQKAAK